MPTDFTHLTTALLGGPSSRAVSRGAVGAAQGGEDLGVLGQVGDALLAPFRGVEGAVQDLYGLLDTVALDALPDYTDEDRLLGTSKTGIGGAIEGISQFLTGFIPVAGQLGKISSFARLGRLKQGAIAGAVTDFAVFDGHESRLSDLVQQFPALENPVTEFLASDANDSELEGRLKNVVEGLGLGMFTDGVIMGLKRINAARKVRAEGGSPQAAQDAADSVASPFDIEQEALEPVPTGEPRLDTDALRREARTDAATRRTVLEGVGIDPEKIKARRDEILASGDDPKVNPRDLTAAERLDRGIALNDTNFSRFRGKRGAVATVAATEQVYRDEMLADPSISRSWDDEKQKTLEELADLANVKDRHAFQTRLQHGLERDKDFFVRVFARIRASRVILQEEGKNLGELFTKLDDGLRDGELLEITERAQQFAELLAATKQLTSEAGRGLNSLKISTEDLASFTTAPADGLDAAGRTAAESAQEIFERGGRPALEKELKRLRAAFNAQGVQGLTAQIAPLRTRAWNIFTEYFMNSILSGPLTQAVNAAGGVITTVYRPLELLAGAGINSVLGRPGANEAFAKALHQISYTIGAFADSAVWENAFKATRENRPILQPNLSKLDVTEPRAISAEANGIDPNSRHGILFNWLGSIVRTPSALLNGTDEAFKQINFRATARASFWEEAVKKGIPTAEIPEFVENGLRSAVIDNQAFSSHALYKEGVALAQKTLAPSASIDDIASFAREHVRSNFDENNGALARIAAESVDAAEQATFTASLTGLGRNVQNLVRSHPWLRLFLPFVRTPLNILGFAKDRFDVIGVMQLGTELYRSKGLKDVSEHSSRLVRDALSQDPARRAAATGRFAAGMSAFFYFSEKAQNGTLTGRGPSDPEQRRILEAAGWLPYSIKTENGYVSYARMDPFATILGTIADTVTYAKYANIEDQSDVETLANGIMSAFANNFTNKSYLTGLHELVRALHDPERFLPKLTQRLASSLVVPSAVNQLTRVSDPVMRDVRGYADSVLARTPWGSDKVPPQRNLLGEPVTRIQQLGSDTIGSVTNLFVPIAYRQVSDDVVNKELAALGHAFRPPRAIRGDFDMRQVFHGQGQQSSYDRWLQVTGSISMNGRSLRASLRRLIKSKRYQRIPVESAPGIDSPRISLVKRIIGRYQRAAFRQVLREYPELREAEGRRRRTRQSLLRGDTIQGLR